MRRNKLHTLIIGPRLNLHRSNVGGATVSFECLIKYYQDHKIPHKIIDTQYAQGVSRIFHFFSRFFYYLWRADIVFLNSSRSGIRNFSPFIYVLGKIAGKKVVIRPFGRSLKSVYQSHGNFMKWLLRNTTMRADILYLQTQQLIDSFEGMSKNVLHLKTSRVLTQNDRREFRKVYRKRFVFLGHVKKTKGVLELIEAVKQLSDDYTIDIYGPIEDAELEYIQDLPYYKGTLKGTNLVFDALSSYDVVILPTYYEGEGYPGAIVEAYSQSMPVITTDWLAIPEIVKDGETGILVQPKSVEAIVEAITSFNTENYLKMSEEALAYYFRNFQVREVMSTVMREFSLLIEEREHANDAYVAVPNSNVRKENQ